MNARIITGIFLALIFGIAVVNLTTPEREFSENENRFLGQMPAFSVENLLSGRYTQNFEKYVTDQFVFRDGWVGLKTLSELALGRKSSNGVYIIDGDTLIDMFDTVDMEQFEKNVGIVSGFSSMLGDIAPVTTMLVPSASMIFSDSLPDFAPEIDHRSLLDYAAEEISGFVDISEALAKHKDEYIYYRTDHHWTSRGAFYAYNSWLDYKSRSPLFAGQPVARQKSMDGYEREMLSASFYGTAYSRASLYTISPDSIISFYPKDIGGVTVEYNGEKLSDTIYETSYLGVKDKYSVFFNANQPVTRVITENKNGKKLLIIKDSYANCFAQFAIEDYEELFMLDLRYYNDSVYDFAESNGVTEILILYSLKGFCSDTSVFYLTR